MDAVRSEPSLVFNAAAQPVLNSWRDGPTKQAILDFVARVTSKDGPHYVKRAERVAVFDNDGTLWPEQPMYFQAAFAIDRLKTLAARHIRWTEAPLAHAILSGDLDAVVSAGERQVLEILALTHAGISTDEFAKTVAHWLATARHPTLKRRYTELHYRPMYELLVYLRANGFKTFIVSGGGVEFIRAFAEKVYGVPPEQVIGSSIATRFEFESGKPHLIKQTRIEFIDDGVGKPSGINRFIGRRPILAIGNSDGDQQMLEWTAAGEGARFVGLVHHTDAVREFAYDRQSHCGRLIKALGEAQARDWTVIDMAKDWSRVFADDEA